MEITNMAEPIKFTEEELKDIQEIQNGYNDMSGQFGQLKIQKILINQQLDRLGEVEENLEKSYTYVQTQENELSKKLNEKYGNGTLDIKTGLFTPSE